MFALGWLAAVLISRDRLVDDLMERAFCGQEEELVRDPDNQRLVRKRIDNRLGMGLLILLMMSKFIYSVSYSSYYTFYLKERFALTTEAAQAKRDEEAAAAKAAKALKDNGKG